MLLPEKTFPAVFRGEGRKEHEAPDRLSRRMSVRITFDQKLSACFNTLDMFAPEAQYTRIYDKEIILEVKFDNYIPDGIQAALQCLNAPMQPVSKYIICTDRMLEVKSYG